MFYISPGFLISNFGKTETNFNKEQMPFYEKIKLRKLPTNYNLFHDVKESLLIPLLP